MAVPSRAGEPPREASVGTSGMTYTAIAAGPHQGKQRAEQLFRFDLGGRGYTLRYGAIVDRAQQGKAAFEEGYLGMPAPCSTNWYHGGFFFLRINGQDVGHTPLQSGVVSETGSRAIADLVWDAKPALVRVRFAGLPADDKLLCEVALEPKEEIKDLRVALTCYPSYFTSWNKRDGDRKILTPSATFNQGQRVELPAAEHWYAVYYDTIFDVAKGEGDGPCAALFLPEAVRTVRFDVGSYGVPTELICKPEARTLRLAFWEFPKVPNAEVLAAFRRDARTWADELRAFDFTPAAVRSFDPKAEMALLAKLTESAEVRRQLGAKADGFRKRIEALASSATGRPGILQEGQIVSFLPAYREFLWELKVAALLAE